MILRAVAFALLAALLFLWGGAQMLLVGGLCAMFGVAMRRP